MEVRLQSVWVGILFTICLQTANAEDLCAQHTANVKASVGYAPPIIPIRVGIDSSFNFSVEFDKKFRTPIGTFDFTAGAEIDIAKFLKEQKFTERQLIVVIGGKREVHQWPILADRQYEVSFEDKYGFKKVTLRDQGICQHIILILEPMPREGQSHEKPFLRPVSGKTFTTKERIRVFSFRNYSNEQLVSLTEIEIGKVVKDKDLLKALSTELKSRRSRINELRRKFEQ